MARRVLRSCLPPSVVISSPAKRILPVVGSITRSRQRATVDLPQPDSPTRPRVSPLATANETQSTARTAGRSPRSRAAHVVGPVNAKLFRKPSTSSNGVTVFSKCETRDFVILSDGHLPRLVVPANLHSAGAAILIPASRRRMKKRGDRAWNRIEPYLDVDTRDRAYKRACIGMSRKAKELANGRRFHQLARMHNGDPLAGLRDDPEIVSYQKNRCARSLTEVAEQFEDTRGDRYVETRRWFVGDEKPRRSGQCHRDHDALAHAARKLMRILLDEARGIGCPDKIEKLQRAPARRRARGALMDFQETGNLPPCRYYGIEGRTVALADHCDLASAISAHFILRETEQIDALEFNRSSQNPAGTPDHAEYRGRTHRLARAGLTNETENLSSVDDNVDAVEHLDQPAVGVEMHNQILHLEELAHRPRILGSRRSRRPSPTKLKTSTVTMIAIPGNSDNHQCPVTIKLAPSETISPHSESGG